MGLAGKGTLREGHLKERASIHRLMESSQIIESSMKDVASFE